VLVCLLSLLACQPSATPVHDAPVDETGAVQDPGPDDPPAETGSDTGRPPDVGSAATYTVTGFDAVSQIVVTRVFTVDPELQPATVNYVELDVGSGVQLVLPYGATDGADVVALSIEGFVESSVEGGGIPTAQRRYEMVPVLISSRFAIELTEFDGGGPRTSVEADGLEVTDASIALSDFRDASPPTLLDCLQTTPTVPCETVGGTVRLDASLTLSDGGDTQVAIDIDGRLPSLWQTRP